MRLSDTIEEFIKTLLAQEEHEVELKRNELATYFNCAPSQINYVLATRFTPEHGYVIESRRGGGGFIRIVRVVEQPGQHLLYLINEHICEVITEESASRLIAQLAERRLITRDESMLMRSAVSAQALAIPIPEQMKDAIRARTLKSMLTTVARLNRTGV